MNYQSLAIAVTVLQILRAGKKISLGFFSVIGIRPQRELLMKP